MNIVNGTIDLLYKQYNYGKTAAQDLYPFCRISVEKYVFSKLYDRLFSMYMAKNEEADEKYLKQRQNLENFKGIRLMKQLNVKKH